MGWVCGGGSGSDLVGNFGGFLFYILSVCILGFLFWVFLGSFWDGVG